MKKVIAIMLLGLATSTAVDNNNVMGNNNYIYGDNNHVVGNSNYQITNSVDNKGNNNQLIGSGYSVKGDNIRMYGVNTNVQLSDKINTPTNTVQVNEVADTR